MSITAQYNSDGYAAPIDVLNAEEVRFYLNALADAEQRLGALHYEQNIHTLLGSAFAMATHPNALDAVEAIIGPNIRLYCSTFIIKEPGSEAFVSWHQDLTYWGLDDASKVVSGWLALTHATPENGCMKMMPKSHLRGQLQHQAPEHKDNVLFMGQTVASLGPEDGVHCSLAAGQMSLHHGWTLHASLPNHSSERRIGLNLQYVNPAVKSTNGLRIPTVLVRGEDHYGHFDEEIPASGEADDAAKARHQHYTKLMTASFTSQHN